MPCSSTYLNPTHREAELQRAAQLLCFVYFRLNKPIESWLSADTSNIYCNRDRAVIELCESINGMTSEEKESIVYDAHSRDSRNLADWWEEHSAADSKTRKYTLKEKFSLTNTSSGRQVFKVGLSLTKDEWIKKVSKEVFDNLLEEELLEVKD